MNKQEAIKELESLKTIGNDARVACYNEGINAGITIIKQLDEPQKKVIPKCAHEFILEGTDLGLSYFEIITSAESFANAKPQDEFSKWLRKNSGLFIRSLLNGYEVEKEQLYCVKIGKGYFSGFDETKVTYVIDDAPGALAQRVKYETREEAEMDAIQIGGTVEEVAE
ncbi:DUF1642 domain-containing protein [Enterococcus hirae]|nr:DUF1642 domain-containing protein [Enterococcus hirae]